MTPEELSEVLKAVSASKPQINQTFNFNAPVGQQISHVDKLVANFDKDMGMTVVDCPNNVADTKAKHRKSIKPKEKREAKTQDTFTINTAKGISQSNFVLLGMYLTQHKIIREDAEGKFIDVFAGESNGCKITWCTNMGALQYLINQLIEKSYIVKPESKFDIAESHFVKPDGEFVTNLKGGCPRKGSKQLINECMKAFNFINPNDEIKRLVSQYEKEEEDIRVNKIELF